MSQNTHAKICIVGGGPAGLAAAIYTSRAALDAEIAAIRERGFALDNEEREEGLHCIGAPIFDYTGAVVAALSVSWPSFRYERGNESDKIESVKAAAARISATLGLEAL